MTLKTLAFHEGENCTGMRNSLGAEQMQATGELWSCLAEEVKRRKKPGVKSEKHDKAGFPSVSPSSFTPALKTNFFFLLRP